MKKIIYTVSFVCTMILAGSTLAQTSDTVIPSNKTDGQNSATTTPKPAEDADGAQQIAVRVPQTKIGFPEAQWNFGTIKQGDIVKHNFVFTNEGENDLILEDVKPTCGCTALDWPREPVKPGESGTIVTQFNSRGKLGQQKKYFTIRYNGTPETERVSFRGNVVAPAPQEKEPKSEPVLNGSSATE